MRLWLFILFTWQLLVMWFVYHIGLRVQRLCSLCSCIGVRFELCVNILSKFVFLIQCGFLLSNGFDYWDSMCRIALWYSYFSLLFYDMNGQCQSCLLLFHVCSLSPICVVCSFKEHIISLNKTWAVTTSPYTSSYFGP